jgi:hypothetical protein
MPKKIFHFKTIVFDLANIKENASVVVHILRVSTPSFVLSSYLT